MQGIYNIKYLRGLLLKLTRIYRIFYKKSPNTDRTTNLGLYNEIINITPKLSADNRSKNLFLNWQKGARKKLIELMGVQINYNIPNYRVINETRISRDLVRCLICFDSIDNVKIYAYLFRHLGKKKVPGIIIIPNSEGNIEQTAGLSSGIDNKNAFYFAKKGFNVITTENRGSGRLSSTPWERILANSISIGKSYQGLILQDHILALNILYSLDETDKENIFSAGVSLGAEQSIYLAALDKRIKAIVTFGWLSDKEALITGHQHSWAVPNIFTYFDISDICALIAPRGALYSNGRKEDRNTIDSFSSKRALKTLEKINQSYKLLGKSVIYKEHPRGHVFDNFLAYGFLKKIKDTNN